jgi:chromosome segregation ATPase
MLGGSLTKRKRAIRRKNKGAKKAKTCYHKGRPSMNPQSQQQQAQKYVQGVLSALENDPGSLSGTERRFGSKYAEVHGRVRQIEGDLTQLREQVRQAEARIKSLELQHQAESGRAGAFLESLVSLKFDVDPPMLPTSEEGAREAKPAGKEGEVREAKPAGDNGVQKPPLKEAASPVAQA